MTCACGRPRKLSGRVSVCALCYRRRRATRAVETRIELAYQRARQVQKRARNAGGQVAA
jgi:hypothetical protein